MGGHWTQSAFDILTGANTGIGKETARDLSGRGARVLMLCRNLEKAEAAVQDIRAADPQARLEVHPLDLSSLASVRACAGRLLEAEERIDFLVNNAGLMVSPKSLRTEDGFDAQLGTNHLGHFLLTNLLLPLVEKAATEDFRPRWTLLRNTRISA